MTDPNLIETPEQAAALPPGQWVMDLSGHRYCLVDTHVVSPQRMWMHSGGNACSSLTRVPYPLRLADIDEPEGLCPHTRTQEMGHCRRCGRVVADPCPVTVEDAGAGMSLLTFGGGAG
jgi:hypothetical protein